MISELPPSWIYSMADYCQMFDLKESELDSCILDYPAGISCFNAEMHEKGYEVKSGDTHYQMSFDEMTAFSQVIFDTNVAHLKKHHEILQSNKDIDSIVAEWDRRRRLFLNDYEAGKKAQRYVYMDLPRLPLDDQSVDIALCSDHLFHNQLAMKQKQTAVIEELCRIAKEVRIFPLQDEKGNIAESLGHVMLDTQKRGCGIEVREVPYHEMKGGNAMLRIWATQCIVDQ